MAASPQTCPKCSHTRSAAEIAPDWQCPACGIAYAKFATYRESVRSQTRMLVAPPRAGERAPPFFLDGSVWILILANLVTLGVALWQGWRPTEMLLVYWGQSIVIGIASYNRILALKNFTAEGFKVFGRPVSLDEGGKVESAFAFALGYALFHAFYLGFLLIVSRSTSLSPGMLVGVAIFALNHYWSYRYNRDLECESTPDIGSMVATPYLRVVPMHLAMGPVLFYDTPGALMLFCLLKTVVDVAMHLAEHARLRRPRGT